MLFFHSELFFRQIYYLISKQDNVPLNPKPYYQLLERYLSFSWLCLQHMEISGPRIESGPQQQSEPLQWQYQILNQLCHQGTLERLSLRIIRKQPKAIGRELVDDLLYIQSLLLSCSVPCLLSLVKCLLSLFNFSYTVCLSEALSKFCLVQLLFV